MFLYVKFVIIGKLQWYLSPEKKVCFARESDGINGQYKRHLSSMTIQNEVLHADFKSLHQIHSKEMYFTSFIVR